MKKNFVIVILSVVVVVLLGVLSYVYFGMEVDRVVTTPEKGSNKENEVATNNTRFSEIDFYYATSEIDRGVDEKDKKTERVYKFYGSYFDKDARELLATVDSEDFHNDFIKDFRLAPKARAVLLVGQNRVELLNLETGKRTLIRKTKQKKYAPDVLPQERCDGWITGGAISGDASKIIVGRRDGFSCRTGNKMIVYEKTESGYEVADTFTPADEQYGPFSMWAHASIVEDENVMIAFGASCNKGPCSPYAGVLDLESETWTGVGADFEGEQKWFYSTGMMLPETGSPSYVVDIGSEESSRCVPPIEALPPKGNTVRVYDVGGSESFRVVGRENTGFRAKTFSSDGKYVLLEQLEYRFAGDCIAEVVPSAYEIISLPKQTIIPSENTVVSLAKTGSNFVYVGRYGSDWLLYVNGNVRQDLEKQIRFLGYAY